MKSFIKIGIIAAGAALALAACNDLSELEERVDSLDGRLTALEAQISGLNANVEAISAFAQSNKTISEVSEADGVWTLKLSDGQTITINQGSIGSAPVISLDDENYWMIDYGEGAKYLEVGGNKVQAGVIPVFGVDANGYWTVSYDGGKTSSQILNSDSQPVSATGSSTSSLFEDVEYNQAAGTLNVTLTGGQEYSLMVVEGLTCAISDVTYGTAIVFDSGETKEYDLTLSGVSSYTVLTPDGWTGRIIDNTGSYKLYVTAPVATKAIVADSGSDITVLALSTGGLAIMAKMSVELSAALLPATASITCNKEDATESSLKYTVTLDRTTSWSYIHQLATAQAPTEESDWQTGSETTLTFDNLASNTEYTLYVIPYRDGVAGSDVSATQATAKKTYATLLDEYNGEGKIEINGRIYEKSVYGEAVHISTTGQTINTDILTGTTGIVFIDPDTNPTYNYTSSSYKLVIAGNNPGQRSTITFASRAHVTPNNQSDGTFVLYNLDVNVPSTIVNGTGGSASQTASYLLVHNVNGTFGYVGIIDTKISLNIASLAYNSSSARIYSYIDVQDSDFLLTANSSNFLGTGSNDGSIGTFSIKNSIFYSESGVNDFRILNGSSSSGSDLDISKLVFENNTFANVYCTTNGTFRFGTLKDISVSKNIITKSSVTAGACFFRCSNTSTTEDSGTAYVGNPTGTSLYDNIVYKGGSTSTTENNFQMFYGGGTRANSSGYTQYEEVRFVETNPCGSTYPFAATGEFASYGAQR